LGKIKVIDSSDHKKEIRRKERGKEVINIMIKKHRNRDSSGLFIPAGLLTGMGIGFLVDNVPAGLFIGLGVGFALMAITILLSKK
jgi:hypothetical protein